ncbi:MAG: S16 family serine protease [Candidatus Aenigmatarchaeota archaeon]
MKYFTVIIFLLFLNTVYAQVYTSTIKIIGVDKDGRGIIGNLTVEIQPGKGRILVDTTPLQGLYTQDSERTAVKVASEITKFDFSKYDVIYSISTPGATNVEGPSAGAAMAIATIAAIKNKTISQSFSITGTVESDHSIGKVGEIFAKAKAAADSGVSLFLIPQGQADQIQYIRKVRTPSPGWRIETIEPVRINVINYAKENWGMNVYEVSTIEEALKYAFEDIKPIQSKTNIEFPSINVSFKSPIKKYEEFDYFAKSALTRAKINYDKAFNKLYSASLTDDVRYNLDTLLKQAKSLLDQGNELLKQGYKYSAGNNGFKSSIYSKTIIDLINYYSASDSNKKLVIDNKIKEIESELEKTKDYVEKKAMDNLCTKDDFEWSVFALQRLNYAENRLSKITFDDVGNAFFDMNVASEWIKISKEFADKIDQQSNHTCLSIFETDARKAIDEAENKINLIKTLGKDTIGADSYLEAAKLEYSKGQYIVAYFDAVIAKSRADASEKFDGKDLEIIYEEFNKTNFTPNSLISTIFYEHSIYTLQEAIKKDSKYDALDAIQILYSSIETEKAYSYVNNKLYEKGKNIDINQIVIILLLLSLFASLFYIAILKTKMKKKTRIKRKIKKR